MRPAGEGSESWDEKPTRRRSIGEIFSEGTEVDAALKRAVREALLLHKKLGYPIVVWQDGKVVEIPPEEIPI